MREYTQIENYKVEIWRRAFQRTMNLSVRRDGRLRVTCGRRLSQRHITRFVVENETFIQERLREIAAQHAKHPPKKMLTGEEFLFFGDVWRLELVWTWGPKITVHTGDKILEMLAPVSSTLADRQKALQLFYKKQAELHLKERVTALSERMGLFPSHVSIRGQRTRWGSCSSEGAISLNWKLLAAPVDVIDYVIVHELAHIRHLDHSPQFWSLVETFYPDWRLAKLWLKEHEFSIGVQFHTEAQG